MQCNEILKKIDAWMGNEVSVHEYENIKQHLDKCPECRRETEAIKQLSDHLKTLPDIHAPDHLSRKTRKAFQKELIKPGLAEWWHGLSFSMQSAVCGVILTGLLFGAVLGNSIITKGTDTSSDPYKTLYTSQGILL